jgi:transcription initiation factor TFIIIB Brf1 subunit/transcription initiation factor TFIIB
MAFSSFNTCKHCQKPEIHEIKGDRVCINCGVVAEGCLLDDYPEWRNYASEYDNNVHNESARAEIDTHQSCAIPTTSYKVVAESIEREMRIPHSVCDDALQMMMEYDFGVRGGNITLYMSACIYYAQRFMLNGTRTREEFIRALFLDSTQFCRACKAVKGKIMADAKRRDIMKRIETCQDIVHRQIYTITSIPESSIHTIKRTVLKIDAKIQRDPRNIVEKNELSFMKVEKVVATYIYVAAQILRIPVTKQTFSKQSNISVATLTKIENVIKTVLSRK